MKVAQINSVSYASTGNIIKNISKGLSQRSIDNKAICSLGEPFDNGIIISNTMNIKSSALESRIKGNYGFENNEETNKIINYLESYKPDIVHIHNIHGHDLNIERLFSYLGSKNIKTVITLHDCWFLTGYCPHPQKYNCEKWKTECNSCHCYKEFSFFMDRSSSNYRRKQRAFSYLNNPVIVTPSRWLAGIAKQSFLKNYHIEVINNGTDINVFRPNKDAGNSEQKIILNVATTLSVNKGKEYMFKLAEMLDDGYKVVLVGKSEEKDRLNNPKIHFIERTHNREELAGIYASADVFVNPTLMDSYPTVNLEAISCGTPVVTFDVGGSPESVTEKTGYVVKEGDVVQLKEKITRICEHPEYDYRKECREYAEKHFGNDVFIEKYIDLYKRESDKNVSR